MCEDVLYLGAALVSITLNPALFALSGRVQGWLVARSAEGRRAESTAPTG